MQTSSGGVAAVALPRVQPRLTIVLVALWTLTGAAYGCVLPFLAVYAARRGLTLTDIGLLGATSAGAAALMQPLVGRVVDRTGRRRTVLAVATCSGGAGYAMLGHVSAVPLLVACAALGTASFYATRVVIVESTVRAIESAGKGAAMMARFRACPAFGYTLTGVAAGILLGRVPFYALFSVGSVLFIAAGLCALALPAPASHHEASSVPSDDVGVGSARRALLTLALMSLLFGIVVSSADTYASLLMRHLHGSFTEVGLTGTIPALAEVPLMILIGGLADRMRRPLLLAAGMAVLPLRFALYSIVASPLALLCVQPLDGLTFSIYAIVGIAVLTDETPRSERAWSLSIYSASNTLGPIAGPLLAGALATRVGLQPMFGFFALGAVAVPLTAAIGLWPKIGRRH